MSKDYELTYAEYFEYLAWLLLIGMSEKDAVKLADDYFDVKTPIEKVV